MPVDIKGNPYDMVWERVTKFHKEHKDGKVSIITEVIQFKDDIAIVKAVVKIDENVFCGHAYEVVGSNQVNEHSALENCETSAIGRALGSAGYIGSSFCTADELLNAKAKPSKFTPEKVDLTNDDWRDLLIGYKAEKKKDLTWKTAEDEDLIWITESGPEKWKPLAKEELNFRNQDRVTATQEGIKKDSVTKEQVDSEFA